MKEKGNPERYMAILLAVCILLTGCGAVPEPSAGDAPVTVRETVPPETLQTEPVQTAPVETEPEETAPPETRPRRTVPELTVAVYPFIPNAERFREVLAEQWAELEPDVKLAMEEWNSYEGPSDCDVLMYDALVLSNLAENGYLLPIAPEEMDNPQGVIPFALDGTFHKGRYYGMPFFLCGEFLIYYQSDSEMETVENVVKLASVVQERQKKNPNTGVVVRSESDAPYHYLDAMVDMRGEYSLYERLPDCKNLDPRVVWYVNHVKSMSLRLPGEKLAAMTRGELFSKGNGFAFFGYSEDMSDMDAVLDKLAIKRISFTENLNIPLMYLDVVSVASHVTDPEKLELCKELMNLIAGETFQKELCFADGEPQYLLPARESAYGPAAEKDPMYGKLYEIVMDPGNRAFRAGADFYKYQDDYK